MVRNPEQTKETILRKSGLLFNTGGYKSTSISQITASTGLTKGAIYRHFKDKEELEKESLAYLSNMMFEKQRDVVRKEKTAGAKLRAIFSFFESYITHPPIKGGCPLLNVAVESDDAHPHLRKEALKVLGVLKDSLAGIISKGIKYGQIRSHVNREFYATLIIASLEGAIMMSKLAGNNEDIRKVIKHLNSVVQEIEV